MKKLLLLAFAAFAFAACSDDDKMPTPPQLETISFSEVELGSDGYLWGKTLATDVDGSLEFEGVIYKEGSASFLSYFSDFGGDRKSTRLNSSHYQQSRMPSSA